jgi:hypothetical protein
MEVSCGIAGVKIRENRPPGNNLGERFLRFVGSGI